MLPSARWLCSLALLLAATAVDAATAVPAPLEPWREWVMHEQSFRDCPLVAGSDATESNDYLCFWPGVLELTADAGGVDVVQQWRVDEAAGSWVPLPGDAAHWPQQVRVDGEAAIVVDRNGPTVRMAPGRHELRARIPWSERPQSLRVAPGVGLVSLRIDGRVISPVQRDGDRVTLGRAERAAPEADSLQLRVHRRLVDDVPAMLTTRIRIAASGQAREELVGPVLPEGFAPLSLASQWPARLEADGRLRVQVSPGVDEVTIAARATAPLSAVTARVPAEPWPQQEIWSYEATPRLRVSVASGGVQVDPRQAEVPGEAGWDALPAFALGDGDALSIEQRSRGLDPSAQNRLHLQREMWLDFDGSGWFARDRVIGEMLQGWRFDAAPPFVLERASAGADPLLVTRGIAASTTGVEWRAPRVDLAAGLRVEEAGATLPVGGWLAAFDQVSTTVHLPDGYRLLAAPGADLAQGSWIAAWDLYDVFLGALLVLLAARLLGWPGALAAFAWLLLGYQEAGAPRWTLLAAVALALVLRALPQGRLALGIEWTRRVALALLVLASLPFAATQLRNALHPQLENEAGVFATDAGKFGARNIPAPDDVASEERMAAQDAMPAPAAAPPPPPEAQGLETITVSGSSINRVAMKKMERYSQSTVTQTGAGEPDWRRGSSYRLAWSGPVLPEQQVRMLIAPSWLVRVLRVAMVGLLAWLLLRLLRPGLRLPRIPRAPPLVLIGLSVFAATAAAPRAHAEAFPPQELLDQLRERLVEAPECAPACATIARAEVGAHAEDIVIVLEVHASERVAVPLPNDPNALALREVIVNGTRADAIARVEDAFWIALPRGVHRVELAFAPLADQVALAFRLPARRVEFDGAGWAAGGLDDGRLLTETLALTRARADGDVRSTGAQQFAPYVRVERMLQLGLEWSAGTTVTRLAPAEGGISLKLPVLAGEHVTTPGLRVEAGQVTVALADREDRVQWEGKLDKGERLVLVAPPLAGHAEVWRIEVSPTWHVEFSGVPVVAMHAGESDGEMRRFEFHPLPGEQLELKVTRPEAAQGATRAIDQVQLSRSVGRRSSESTLRLDLRASQGGEHALALPAGAELLASSRDGAPLNLRLEDGRLSLPLVPGTNRFELRWREPFAGAFDVRTPALDLGLPAANIDLGIDLPADRWLLATRGPVAGPAVLYWSELALLALLAFALGRLPRSPLKTWQWLLLGVGFAAFSWVALLLVVAWLFALDWRARMPLRQPAWFNLVQVALGILTLVALLCLLAAVRQGLLGQPDMAVAGNGSSQHALRWFADRSPGALPVASAWSLPLWVHKLAMLAWALWLASALVGWLRRGFAAWGDGGYWRSVGKPRVDLPAVEPPEVAP